jgi:hypothetical protein
MKLSSMKKFTDYNGPQGLFIATGEKIVPLESTEGISSVAQSAMLSSLGGGPEAMKYQVSVKASVAVAAEFDAEPLF